MEQGKMNGFFGYFLLVEVIFRGQIGWPNESNRSIGERSTIREKEERE